MTPTIIPCATCKTMALFGVLMVRATHRLLLRAGDVVTERYLCPFHAEQLARTGGVWVWETLDCRLTP